MPHDDSIQSIQRAVKVLYAVAGVEDGCSISQIANKTGLKPNTVYKFTRTLEREHLLTRKKSPLRFVLGRTVHELQTLDDERHLLTVSSKILARTQAKLLSAAFTLLELDGTNTHQRLSVDGNRPGVVIQRREYIIPLYEKASSLLFLAHADADQTHKIYAAHPFETKGKTLWGSQARLDAFLEDTRRLGYCQPDIPDCDGPHFRVAAPVFSQGNEVIAAVGACILTSEPKKNRPLLIRLCINAAQEITRSLSVHREV
ncbi:MAG: helix-turn-helix domain-containing protein [Kiritimatiellia bacterium]